MKRQEFFHHLAAMAGLPAYLLPVADLLLQEKQKPVLPAAGRYVLYDGWVAGFWYYSGPEMEEQLCPSLPLQLKREPHNPHDHRAIEIYLAGTAAKLGYIARADNKIMARLLDQNAPLRAQITAFVPEDVAWDRIKIRVEMANGYHKG